ncbi:MAG: diaminopimelate decarboxylase [Bacteroidetes bacterium]|nr:diaminopimelate decarboxylase [Bacteroidota bacterium]
MEYFEPDYFHYKNNQLYCEELPVQEIAEDIGSPAYIYSKNYFIDRYKEFDEAFKEIKHTIFYACKSNFNLSVIKTFTDIGSGVDVNSEGELLRALKVGVDPQKIIMSGVGKTSEEIKLAIEKDLLMIKAESEEEIFLINEIAASLNKTARVAIRVNPDVDAQTHPYISTGLAENKFGVDTETALKLFRKQKDLKNIKFTGIDMHIGSQIIKVEPFVEAAKKLSELILQLKSDGIFLEHLDMGGGVGSTYNNEKTFAVKDFANALLPLLKKLECDVFFEPGRYLIANGGILLTKVLYNKKNHDKNFIVVDSAMNDLLRPSIYSAYHHIQPVVLKNNRKDIVADIVGPVCESGDFFAKKREIAQSNHGEYLAIMSAGAYGMPMASNYNSRRRPAEVLVDGKNYKIIRSRETFDHLFFDEPELI